ncbi:MAG: hypothetical protein SF053_13295 [Bacteroidia bacterium]|nr:hypothetical protein [Bacteroidia bacterium]
MSIYSWSDILTSIDRYKIYTLRCEPSALWNCIAEVLSASINVLNLGKEVAGFIKDLPEHTYLDIEVMEFIPKLLEKHSSQINNAGNHMVAIYNLGLLLEPMLKLNTVQLLSEFSKSKALIIIWEHDNDGKGNLSWATQKNSFSLDFSMIPIKQLQYAI